MRSWCFDSQESGGVYDREYGSADIREVVYKIAGNGIFMDEATSLQVSADSGLQVAIQPGNCFINGAFGAVDTAETLTHDASASGRYDIVVARFDLSLSYRSIRLAIIKGTEGSSTAPTPTQTASVHDLQLAKVNVRAGATSILQSDITDTRTDDTVCGIVNGVAYQAAALQDEIDDLGTAKQDKTNSLAAETTLDDADYLPFYDASATAHKKTLWSNIKAKLKTYFDALYVSGNKTSLTITGNGYGAFNSGVAEFYPIINKVYINAVFNLTSTPPVGSEFNIGLIGGITVSSTVVLAVTPAINTSGKLVPVQARLSLGSGLVRILSTDTLTSGSPIQVAGWVSATLS